MFMIPIDIHIENSIESYQKSFEGVVQCLEKMKPNKRIVAEKRIQKYFDLCRRFESFPEADVCLFVLDDVEGIE